MIKKLKKLVRPDRIKLGLSTILFGLGSASPNPLFSLGEFMSYGWPLPVYRVTAVMDSMPPQPAYEIFIAGILANLVVWYFIGASSVELYRRKKQ